MVDQEIGSGMILTICSLELEEEELENSKTMIKHYVLWRLLPLLKFGKIYLLRLEGTEE